MISGFGRVTITAALLGMAFSGYADAKKTIAVIPKGTTHEYWKSVHAGANKAAAEFGVNVIWKGPLKEDDRSAQISVVEDFIARGVDGIVLAPLDDSALALPVRNAAAADIPVVIFDSALKGQDYVSFVATDNHKGGEIAGDDVVKLLGGKGNVAMLRYQEGSASTMEREKGFLDAIAKAPGIKVVSSNQYGGATAESAQKASENLIASLKKADGTLGVDAVYTPNESTTFGMLRALQEQNLAGKVKFVGFDASSKLVAALKDGQINGLVIQNPFKMGYLSVKSMKDHLDGKPVEKRIDTGATLATKENASDPAIKAILEPDLTQWLK